MAALTKEQFEQQYAERSGLTVEQLHQYGQVAIECDCGEPGCEGWMMVAQESAPMMRELYGPKRDE